MSLLLKGGTCLVVGGGACTIPFLNFNSFVQITSVVASVDHSSGGGDTLATHSTSSVSQSSGETDTQETLTYQEEGQESENCVLKIGQDEVTSTLTDSPRYVAFSCDNSGKEDSEINANWTIWMPVTFLKEQEDWVNDENKIEIKTQTSRIETETEDLLESEFYRTKFESASFSFSSIEGEWGRSLFGDSWENGEDSDSYIWRVKITDPELESNFMYLRLENRN